MQLELETLVKHGERFPNKTTKLPPKMGTGAPTNVYNKSTCGMFAYIVHGTTVLIFLRHHRIKMVQVTNETTNNHLANISESNCILVSRPALIDSGRNKEKK